MTNKQLKEVFQISKPSLHFFVIWALLLALLLDIGVAYRSLAYINILVVMYYGFSVETLKKLTISKAIYLCLIPIVFLVLDILATMQFKFMSDFNQFLLVVFFAIGIYMVMNRQNDYIKKNSLFWLNLMLSIFLVAQLVNIFLLNHRWGTHNNSHYLAINAALLMPAVVYAINYNNSKINLLFLLGCIATLTGMVIYTSSRPTWIGLILASIYILFFLIGKRKLQALFVVITLPALLFFTNIGNFGVRFKDLARHISTEERNVIWRDAWNMQKTSDVKQWLVGHGLKSYENDFIGFSSYHAQRIDFASPHNWILEMMYISGIIGLIVFVFSYIYTWRQLVLTAKHSAEYKALALLLSAMLIISLVMGFLTVKSFSHYTVFQLAFFMGLAVWLRDNVLNKKVI